MTNENTKPQQQLGANSYWNPRSSIWQDNTNNSSRGTLQDAVPAASNPLAPTNEMESYRTQLRGGDASARSTSGSTSPITTRDDMSYFATKTQRQPAIGQRSTTYNTGRWSPSGNVALVTRQATQTSEYSDYGNKEQSGVRFGQNAGYGTDRTGQATTTASRSFPIPCDNSGAAAAFARDDSRGRASRPGSDSHAQGTHYGGHAFNFQGGGSSGQLQRSSFGSNDSATRPALNPSSSDLDRLSRGVASTSLADFDGQNEAATVDGHLSSAHTSTKQPWRFNPATQDWDNGMPPTDTNDVTFQSSQGGGYVHGFPTAGSFFSGRNGSAMSGNVAQALQHTMPAPVTRANGRRLGQTNYGGQSQQAVPQQLFQNYMAAQPYYHPTATPPPFNVHYGSAANMVLPHPLFQHQPQFSHGGVHPGHHSRPGRGYDTADARCSPLLREIKMSHKTHKRYELRDIKGHVIEFCGDQNGARFIQDHLPSANTDEKEMVFNEIIDDAIPLMKDTFGNYVIQRLFAHCTMRHKEVLAEKMTDCMLSLTLDSHGCRVVQTALDYVLANQQGALIRKLEPDIMKLMKHENGNHVIQKALEVARPQDVEFVITALRGKVRELACHSTACRVVQSAMKFDHARAMIIEEVLPNLLMLANDQYGNYVIQSILVKGVDGDRARVIDSLQGSIVHLSKQKHASNVIEKCVIHGTPQQRQKMEAEMLATGPDGNSFLCSMVADLYANYVVQKHMKLTPDKRTFSAALRTAVQWARASGHTGKNLDSIAHQLEEMTRQLGGQEQATPSTRPASPLQLDVGSAAPTPNLTMEPNSPSSSPPSTTESAADDFVSVPLKARMTSANGGGLGAEVRVAGEDSA